jgi:hypothetical protein
VIGPPPPRMVTPPRRAVHKDPAQRMINLSYVALIQKCFARSACSRP